MVLGAQEKLGEKSFESPLYRNSRLATRLILRARKGRHLTDWQRNLVKRLAADDGISARDGL
jgi:hypothetical protein